MVRRAPQAVWTLKGALHDDVAHFLVFTPFLRLSHCGQSEIFANFVVASCENNFKPYKNQTNYEKIFYVYCGGDGGIGGVGADNH